MKELPDASAAEWMMAALDKLEAEVPLLARHLVPQGYAAHAVILHAIWEEISSTEEGQSWDEWERAGSSTSAERAPDGLADALRDSMLVRGSTAPQGPLRRLSWRELAGRLDLAFSPRLSEWDFTRAFGGSWPRSLHGPGEGRLDEEQAAILAGILEDHAGVPDAFFRFWWLATRDWNGKDPVYRGRLSEVPSLFDPPFNHGCSPTHWFPEDRSWCVSTDYDLSVTLVGGPEALIARILTHPGLEALPLGAGEPLRLRDAA